MHFVHPLLLVLAAVVFVTLGLLFVLTDHARRRALARVGAERLLPHLTASFSPGRRRVRQTALAVGATLLVVALARPQLGYRWQEVHRRGVDLLFAIDTSKSMLTRDVKPDRLERAKLAVRSLVEKFPENRVGLVVFAGDAFVETPLTLDHAIFDESVAALDSSVIPLGGTNLASAIDRATVALAGDTHDKVLVLLTDGEDLSGDALDAAERAAKQGVVIDTIGVGTPRGELVPEPDANGTARFVRDENGKLVTSRLDEARLAAVARATGGEYRPLGDAGQGLEALYRDKLAKLPTSDLASQSVRVPIERYQWPLALGLILLAVEPLVGERKRRRARGASFARTAAATGVVAGLVLVPSAAWASPQSAERAYAKGDFATAEHDYAAAAHSTPSDARLSFNTGAAAYRKGAYDDAAKAFESTLRSTNLGLQQEAYYNLGNASFRIGEASLAKGDTDGTKARWKQAIDEYQGALRLRGDDADARYNLELVKRRLAALDQQQKNQQRPQNKPDQGQGKSPQNQGQQQRNQHGQGQQQNQGAQGQQQNQNGQGQKQNQGPGGQQQNQSGSGQAQNQPPVDQGKPQQGHGQNGANADEQGHRAPGQASSGKPDEGDESRATDEARSAPGQLSKQDAEALLDSLRGELTLRPNAQANAKHKPASQEPQRDW
ncbi:MAG TPA: VWA domain-containing protein [Polyangiaceae bacterium]|nr:VWA domain-containing protein [Polyangiaceae bacterium]